MNQYNLIDKDGDQIWYLDTEDRSADVLNDRIGSYTLCWHRTDGPAYIGADGTRAWYVNGKLHRIDGPAVIWPDGYQTWWVNGKLITNEYDLSIFDSEEGRMILLIKYSNQRIIYGKT